MENGMSGDPIFFCVLLKLGLKEGAYRELASKVPGKCPKSLCGCGFVVCVCASRQVLSGRDSKFLPELSGHVVVVVVCAFRMEVDFHGAAQSISLL